MKKILFSSLFVLVLMAGAVAQPTGPHVFSGDAVVDGDSVEGGTVTARANGNIVGSAQITDGSYEDLLVQGIDNQTLVKFYIDGLDSNENHTYRPWNVSELDLAAEIESDKNYTVSDVQENVSAGNIVEVKAPGEANTSSGGVDEVNITITEDTDSVEVNVTVTDKKTTDEVNENVIEEVDDGDTEVEGVIDVETNVKNEDIGDTSIGFRLKKSSIDNNPRSVVLIHFEDGSRVGVLETTYLEERTENLDDGFYRFRSETSSFSSYAMTSDSTKPEADAGSDQDASTGDSVEFNASDSSDNVGVKNYSWDFGDGDSETGKSVTHEFDYSGLYEVELTVWDEAGNSDTDTINVDVDSSSEKTSEAGADEDTGDEEDTEDNQSEQPPGLKDVEAALENGMSKADVGQVSKNQRVSVQIPESAADQAVRAVSFKAAQGADNVEVTVEELEGEPEETGSAGTEVYRYQNISMKGLEDSQVDNANISFEVSKEFVDSRDRAPEDVVMKRYNEEWEEFETELSEELETSYSYEASTPGFSYYAVALEEEPVEPPTDGNETGTNETTGNETQVEGPDETGPVNWMPVLGALILLLAVAGYYYREELQTFMVDNFGGAETAETDTELEFK